MLHVHPVETPLVGPWDAAYLRWLGPTGKILSMASSDYLLPFQPSLAQATNTRLDSACKHIQQCRVATDEMLNFVGDIEEIQRNKYRYCIHKDELVVGLGRPW